MATTTKTKSRRSCGKKTSFKDTYADVTARVIAALEAGTVMWHKPWQSAGPQMPTSLSTGKPYRGINVFLLAFEGMEKGYSSPHWGTYNQMAELAGMVKDGNRWVSPRLEDGTVDPTPRGVRKGEKSTEVVFWKLLRKEEMVDGQPKVKKIPMLRTFNVFNLEQCEFPEGTRGAKKLAATQPPKMDPVEAAEAVIAEYLATGPSLRHGGDKAFYRPSEDRIQMPHQADFDGNDAYYSTLYHEVTHSTGHSKRLARQGIADGTFGSFGDAVYSNEELVAEMGAAMLSAIGGVDNTIEASAAYLAHWRDTLKGDNKLIVQAAAQAQKAVDLVLGTTFDNEEES